ncbi:hypothetical protein ACQ86G_14305 [Roseateles chitinivorans]|uniref:hypothetical protein n=1 Tax=Roseateles chitinivorans TaxID=2917965 RepID=UPI003D66F0E9
MDHAAIDPTQFIHIRMVLSMVVSLSIARLLSGLAKFVQHPGRLKVDGVHLLWALYMMVTLIHFWWWEFALSRVGPWHFLQFVFVVGYSAVLYLLCAILFPDDIAEYAGYRDYFQSRRRWFFGILAFTLLLDVADSALKGTAHLQELGTVYGVKTAGAIVLCGVAALVTSRRVQWALVVVALAVQQWRILRLYNVLS